MLYDTYLSGERVMKIYFQSLVLRRLIHNTAWHHHTNIYLDSVPWKALLNTGHREAVYLLWGDTLRRVMTTMHWLMSLFGVGVLGQNLPQSPEHNVCATCSRGLTQVHQHQCSVNTDRMSVCVWCVRVCVWECSCVWCVRVYICVRCVCVICDLWSCLKSLPRSKI